MLSASVPSPPARESGSVATLRISREDLQANRGKIAIYFRVQGARFARFSIQQHPDRNFFCTLFHQTADGW